MNKKLKSNMISSTVHEDIKRRLDESFEKRVETADNKEVAGWFMGTRGENLSVVAEIILSVLNTMVGGRELLYPNDPNYITPNVKLSEGYKQAIASVKHHTNHLLEILNKYSLPTQSLRYQGHMLWDVTLPSVIGYFAAMLQNQNNVTPQASPATTILELLASNDIARMAGFKTLNLDEEPADENEINSWSHISSCGSVADIESLWAAREVKFLPLGIKYALKNDELLKSIADSLKLPGSDDKLLVSASSWELLNLEQDDILALPQTIMRLLPDDRSKNDEFLSEIWSLLASKYSFNALGTQFFSKYMADENISAPAIIVPSTKHYSWQKAASMLGMGNGKKGLKEEDLTNIDCIQHDGLINVYVDSEGKVNTRLLKKVLTTCRDNKKPVVMVVGVMGTTEEGAVDPMEKILEIRDNFRAEKGNSFDYSVHADAAWGGYFLTCWRNEYRMEDFLDEEKKGSQGAEDIFEYSDTFFRKSVYDSMTSIRFCDSATIDPHKMGYIVYPAGSLVYRNDRIVNLITFSAPYISSGINTGNINTRNIGECGIEGSKSGASPASVYLSHAVIRPDRSGYGKIIHQSMLNSKLFYLYLYSLNFKEPDNKFEIIMFNKPNIELDDDILKKYLWEKTFSVDTIPKSLKKELKKIAGDQNIVDYIFIDKRDKSIERTIDLNNTIFKTLSLDSGQPITGSDEDIFVSMTTFKREDYGAEFMNTLANRLYLEEEVDTIPCIRSVIMDPWAVYTDAEEASVFNNFFTDVFIPQLRDVVNELCEEHAIKQQVAAEV